MNIRQLLVAAVVLCGVTQLKAGGSKRLLSPREQHTLMRTLVKAQESEGLSPHETKQLQFLKAAQDAATQVKPQKVKRSILPHYIPLS